MRRFGPVPRATHRAGWFLDLNKGYLKEPREARVQLLAVRVVGLLGPLMKRVY